MIYERNCGSCPYAETNNKELVCGIWSSDDDECPLLYQDCPVCGKHVLKDDMALTYDCHGIPFRFVCYDCYDKIMEDKGYDGEYYTELDECIDDEW